jgi:hypothetical protein
VPVVRIGLAAVAQLQRLRDRAQLGPLSPRLSSGV